MPENDISYAFGNNGPNHDDVRRFIRETLEKHEQKRLRRLVDDRR